MQHHFSTEAAGPRSPDWIDKLAINDTATLYTAMEQSLGNFSPQFRKLLVDLIIQHPDEFKKFVGGMLSSTAADLSKYKAFSDAIAENDLQSITEAFQKMEDDEEAKSINDDDFGSDLGSDLSSENDEDEAEDNLGPLISDRGESLRNSEDSTSHQPIQRFAMMTNAASSKSSPVASRRQLLSRTGTMRREESFRKRTSIRQECDRRRSMLREESIRPNTSTEDALVSERNYCEFLEDEVDQLEKLLDDQENEIDDLDRTIRKCKKKNNELLSELKTKKRSILILEEKYALLKAELSNANKRAATLHMKLSEVEEDRDMTQATAEDEREQMETELTELRTKLKKVNDVHNVLAEKDMQIMNLMAEKEGVEVKLAKTKKQRDALKKSKKKKDSAAESKDADEDSMDEVDSNETKTIAKSLQDSFVDTVAGWGKKKKDKAWIFKTAASETIPSSLTNRNIFKTHKISRATARDQQRVC